MLASFLVEVAQRLPEAVYPSVSCLLPHLGYEVCACKDSCVYELMYVVLKICISYVPHLRVVSTNINPVVTKQFP